MRKPCDDCPFLRVGGIRLRAARVRQIAGGMLSPQGATFTCHKSTVEDTDSGKMVDGPNAQHCAGALIFGEKNGNSTQMMRIAERLRMYDPMALMADKEAVASVFDDLDEMVKANEWPHQINQG